MSGKSERNGSTGTEKKADLGDTKSNLQGGCGCLFVVILGIAAYQGCTATDTSAPPRSTASPRTMSKAEALKVMTAKINDFALEPLDRKYNPEGYAKVGKRVWATSNELRRWAGLAALQKASCPSVSAIALWERATRSRLSWHVVCGNDERFVISEAQARSVRAQLDPKATDADRKEYATPAEPAQPMSAVWANFNEAGAVRACEGLIEEAAVNRNSFETSGTAQVERDDETGQAKIYRDFSSDNAMGATISGKYQCVVDASGMGRVLSVKTRDAFGVHTVF